MVVFPKEFVAIKYPGYFWNTEDKRLYSIKVTGELRPLYLKPAYMSHSKGYAVSVKGKKRFLEWWRLDADYKSTDKTQVVGVVKT
jgi:hypothetical protein